MEFLFFSQENWKSAFSCPWDWSCFLYSSGLFIHLLLPSAPSKCIHSFNAQPTALSDLFSAVFLVTPSICWRNTLVHGLVFVTLLYLHSILGSQTLTSMVHSTPWSLTSLAPSNSMISLLLHLSHPLPWSFLYLVSATTFSFIYPSLWLPLLIF